MAIAAGSMIALGVMGVLLVGATGARGQDETAPVTNGKIAFVSDRNGDHDIYVIDPDGTNETRLTTTPGIDSDPDWSPDGTKIAFAGSREGGGHGLSVMDADGTGEVHLTDGADYAPTWSPDGQQIAFERQGDRGSDIYVIDADGTNERNLTRHYEPDQSPSWSPDGLEIAFAAKRFIPWEGARLRIYVVQATGKGADATLLCRGADPEWSPDGNQIVFTRGRQLWVMKWDGSDQTQLTENGAMGTWSPDGQKIAYAVAGLYGWDIWTMDADGTHPKQVTIHHDDDADPTWQPVRP